MVIVKFDKWVYKASRLSPLVVKHSVVVMTVASELRKSQIEPYG